MKGNLLNFKSGIRTILVLSIILILQSPSAWASNKRKRAEAKALFHAAYVASGIKAKGSPPFHLKARFKFYGNQFQVAHGTYGELWTSPDQHRISYSVPSASDVYGVSNGQTWRKANPPYTTFMERLVKDAMGWGVDLKIGRPDKIRRIQDEVSGTRHMTCVIPRHKKDSDTFCFDPKSGRLVQWTQPDWRATYQYSDYQPWGRKWVPRKIAIVQSGSPLVQITIKSVAPAGQLSASAFAPPFGADVEKQVTCQKLKGGEPVSKVQPGYPQSAEQHGFTGTVILYGYIGKKGRVHGVRVVQSIAPLLDASAIRAIQKWRFKPIVCQGVPRGLARAFSVHFVP